jgi:hypothetical protein
METLTNVITYSNIWAATMGALINKSAAIPWEINPAVLSYLDWIFFFIKEHADGILDKFVRQSFRRMKEGYEGRQVAKSVWTNAMKDLALAKNKDEAVLNHLQNLHINALPVAEVPAAAHSFLCRSIHMGCTLMIVVCAKHLDVPIIPLKNLVDFFNREVSEDGEGYDQLNQVDAHYTSVIRKWIMECQEKRRFCVDEDGKDTCYITSDGDINQNPLNDKICMLRVKKSRVQNENITQAIGFRVRDLFGLELNETCHMGPEASIYGNALWALQHDWVSDFRQLYGSGLYNSKQHMMKLGVWREWFKQLGDWEETVAPSFARTFTTVNANNDVTSYSYGLHVWGLLLMVSMGACTLHPHVTSDIARTLLKDILLYSPVSATPGNTVLVRSFDIHTTCSQRIIVDSQNRPKHFPRPMCDLSFATTGKYTYAKSIGDFMPEDVLHCGFLFNLGKTLACEIFDIPGRAVKTEYEIMADTHYSVWNGMKQRGGWLLAESVTEHVSVHLYATEEYEEEELFSWGYDDWTVEMRKEDLIILPMIFRAGACVYIKPEVEDGEVKVGLVIPLENTNFNHERGGYQYIMQQEGEPVFLPTMDTLKQIIPVGTEMYLDVCTSPSAEQIKEKIPRHQRNHQWLLVRLNTPSEMKPDPKKVYVTALQSPTKATTAAGNVSSVTFTVDPWELKVKLTEEQVKSSVISSLVF